MGQRPQEDGIVRYGDHVSLKHVMTGRLLTSADERYIGGSNQQKVFAGDWSPTEYSTWIVMPTLNSDEEPGYEVGWDDLVRLKHCGTRRNLHSHGLPSPITEQQEVSCFGSDYESDINDIWRVTRFYGEEEESEDNVSL
ncbi:MIR motif-containing protein [Spinellus fusiger]|nr:MIR motif-containing protein [Spinellus fusiger]